MKRGIAIVAALLLAACSWSNSLYQARIMSHDAERAEREPGTGGAQVIWGQVQAKAESAYARAPNGPRGAEALWLQGHAAAHSFDCPRAVPLLRHVVLIGAARAWHDQLLLELGNCEARTDPQQAVATYALLFQTSSNALRQGDVRLAYAHALIQVGDWDAALEALGTVDSRPARVDRALALVHRHLADSAWHQLQPVLAASDTTIAWSDFVTAFAVESVPLTDSLLQRLLAIPKLAPNTGTRWVVQAGISALPVYPAAGDRWLTQAANAPTGTAATDARMLRQQLRLDRVASLPVLARLVDSLGSGSTEGSVLGARFVTARDNAHRVVERNASIATGAPNGDIAIFELAGFARDTLGIPRVSAWLFGRIEREWPASPYLGKALLARIDVDPDSADAVRARALALHGSAYISLATGDAGARLRVTRLEDSLGRMLRDHPPFANMGGRGNAPVDQP